MRILKQFISVLSFSSLFLIQLCGNHSRKMMNSQITVIFVNFIDVLQCWFSGMERKPFSVCCLCMNSRLIGWFMDLIEIRDCLPSASSNGPFVSQLGIVRPKARNGSRRNTIPLVDGFVTRASNLATRCSIVQILILIDFINALWHGIFRCHYTCLLLSPMSWRYSHVIFGKYLMVTMPQINGTPRWLN